MFLLAISDQLTKYLILLNKENLYRDPLQIIPGVFNIVYVRNTGAAWGIFHGNNFALLAIAIVALIAFSIFFKSITEWYPERVAGFFMIISGIIGNSIDRVFRGSVVDFLDFYYGQYHWPSFNVADSSICVGVFLIIISSLLRKTVKKEQSELKSDEG